MNRGNTTLRRRRSGARGGARASPPAPPKEESKNYYNILSPTKKKKPQQSVSKRVPAEKSSGGNLFQRLVGRRKKAAAPPKRPAPRPAVVNSARPLMTPVTLDSSSDEGGAIEIALRRPLPCERVASYAETEPTHASSEYGGPTKLSRQRPAAAATPLPRSQSARPASLVDSVPLATTRSARTFGNESLGEAQPDAPRRGYLPPLLGEDDDASTCSGITMDFTYDPSAAVRAPASLLQLQPPPLRTMARGSPPYGTARGQSSPALIPSYIRLDQPDEVPMLSYY